MQVQAVKYFTGMLSPRSHKRYELVAAWFKTQDPRNGAQKVPQDAIDDFVNTVIDIHAENEIRISGGFFD